jgi:hypothetical protein
MVDEEEDVWSCFDKFEPECSSFVSVIDNTDHLTREACVGLHIPEVSNARKMIFSEEALGLPSTDGRPVLL